MHSPVETSTALFIFNRPKETAKVLDAIRQVRLRRLFVVADGPRKDVPEDAEKCALARAVIDGVDWPCEVHTNYSDTNLGTRRSISSGLDWVFAQVEEAIVLEDDCVPEPSFFPYCEELLQRYRDDPKIMVISGANLFKRFQATEDSYYFSRYPLIWGWASWRRVWQQHYDVDIQRWPELREQGWLKRFLRPLEAQYWGRIFDQVRDGYDAWDYSLLFACWLNDALALHPRRNLVSNIGWSADATHTTDPECVLAHLPSYPMTFPLRHPGRLERHAEADDRLEQMVYSGTLARTISIVHDSIRARRDGKPGPPDQAFDPLREG